MILRGIALGVVILLSLCQPRALGQEQAELNTLLMKSTFELRGPASGGKTTFGTVFIMGKPIKNEEPTRSYLVLLTAAHVLDEVLGDKATLLFHRRKADGSFKAEPYEISIRRNGKSLYVRNPNADVAAMYLTIKDEELVPDPVLSMDFLATDDRIQLYELHPGDELLCLGFPAAIDFNSFPVIRSGVLASYPLTPSKAIGAYFYNFHVFPGNSGGPVYFSYETRRFGGALHSGPIQGVLGLVSQQVSSTLPEYQSLEMDVSRIVPSTFILETINLLPESPSTQ